MSHNLVPERRAEGGGANDANRSQQVHNWRVKEDVVDKAPSVAALWEGAGERWDDTNRTANSIYVRKADHLHFPVEGVPCYL